MTKLGFRKHEPFGIVWNKDNIEICTDYQISLSVSLNIDNPYFTYSISWENDLPENLIKKAIEVAEYVENELKEQ